MLFTGGALASWSWTPAWMCSRCAALIAAACAAVDGPYVGSQVSCFIIHRVLETSDASCPGQALSLQQPPYSSNAGVSSGAAAARGVRHRPHLGAAAVTEGGGVASLDASRAADAVNPPLAWRWAPLQGSAAFLPLAWGPLLRQVSQQVIACCAAAHRGHPVGNYPRAVNETHAPSQWIAIAQRLSA